MSLLKSPFLFLYNKKDRYLFVVSIFSLLSYIPVNICPFFSYNSVRNGKVSLVILFPDRASMHLHRYLLCMHECDDKPGICSFFTPHRDLATHSFYNGFCERQADSDTIWIDIMMHPVESFEYIAQIFFRDSHSMILHIDSGKYRILFCFDRDLRFFR